MIIGCFVEYSYIADDVWYDIFEDFLIFLIMPIAGGEIKILNFFSVVF